MKNREETETTARLEFIGFRVTGHEKQKITERAIEVGKKYPHVDNPSAYLRFLLYRDLGFYG